jgi:hypothetical protein
VLIGRDDYRRLLGADAAVRLGHAANVGYRLASRPMYATSSASSSGSNEFRLHENPVPVPNRRRELNRRALFSNTKNTIDSGTGIQWLR